MIIQDLTEKRFGRLIVLSREPNNDHRQSMWKCLCSCGRQITIRRDGLVVAKTQSCGCLQKESVTTHGLSDSSIYHRWTLIKDRCLNPNNADYKRYGGRGIGLCERWVVFENFFADMGYPPSREYTIDRIDNNGNYEKANCRWIKQITNSRNTRQAKYWFIHGHRFESSTLAAKFYGVSHHTIMAWCGLNKKVRGLPLCYSVKKYVNY